MELSMPLTMKLTAITLDCPDPRALVAFYQQATGLRPRLGADRGG
jgi:Glyoxalase-like domain